MPHAHFERILALREAYGRRGPDDGSDLSLLTPLAQAVPAVVRLANPAPFSMALPRWHAALQGNA